MSLVLMLFLAIGSISATESINVSDTEDSNLIGDNDDSLSAQNKLEVSSEDSISETNIVNSHDDNLGNYPDDDALKSNNESYYGVNNQQSTSGDVAVVEDNTLSSSSSSNDNLAAGDSSTDDVIAASTTDQSVKTATAVSTGLSISDTHYAKSATYFDVTLKDNDGNALTEQKIILKVDGKKYSGVTNSKGIASIKTKSLAVGTYTVSLSYEGNSNYSSSSLSKKVKVLSSLKGSDLTKYYGYTSQYKAQFWKDSSVLANTKVSFKINGKTYTKTTNSKGIAKLNIKLSVGKYTITINNPYSKEKASYKIVVKKDKTTLKPASSKTYVNSHKKGTFSVTLKTKHNVLLKNKKVHFTYNKKTVTVKTNENGKATLTIPVLSEGTYKISYKYDGNKKYHSASGKSKFIVHKATTKVSASTLKMDYNDGSKFKVKLTSSSGKLLVNKTVKIKINGKTYTKTTNSKGLAKFTIKDLKPKIYNVKYYHSKKGAYDYSSGSGKVIIFKATAKLSSKNLNMNYKDGSYYNVTVKDQSGKVLKNVFVKSKIGSKSYMYSTNSEGIAKLKISKPVGYYNVKTIVVDPCYKSMKTLSKHILVNGTKFIGKDMYISSGKKCTYSLKAVDGKNNPIKKINVSFTFKGKSYTYKTDSKGIVKINLGKLSKGTYKLKYSHESSSGSSKIYSVNKISIKKIVTASKTVNKYVKKHSSLPSTVKIGNVKFPIAEYLYLASKAIVKLKSGDKSSIAVKDVGNPTHPKAAKNLGNLKGYKSVAKKVVKTAESKGVMPNSVSSSVGKIGYKGLVYAFARVMESYGEHHKLPSHIAIKSLTHTTLGGKLNSLNKISNLAAYLAASLNCQVNNAKIKKLVTKLTKNCKSEKSKANAIYTYVRDTISYSFYYNTKYGATGILKSKSGNCVDHTHLLIAMYRSAGLAARYVHGTCTFSSGSTYGHVWAQVLIGDTWTVADATSSRNSLGKVANWNVNTYKLQSYSASISF